MLRCCHNQLSSLVCRCMSLQYYNLYHSKCRASRSNIQMPVWCLLLQSLLLKQVWQYYRSQLSLKQVRMCNCWMHYNLHHSKHMVTDQNIQWHLLCLNLCCWCWISMWRYCHIQLRSPMYHDKCQLSSDSDHSINKESVLDKQTNCYCLLLHSLLLTLASRCYHNQLSSSACRCMSLQYYSLYRSKYMASHLNKQIPVWCWLLHSLLLAPMLQCYHNQLSSSACHCMSLQCYSSCHSKYMASHLNKQISVWYLLLHSLLLTQVWQYYRSQLSSSACHCMSLQCYSLYHSKYMASRSNIQIPVWYLLLQSLLLTLTSRCYHNQLSLSACHCMSLQYYSLYHSKYMASHSNKQILVWYLLSAISPPPLS